VLNNILDKSHQSWSWVTGGRNFSGVGSVHRSVCQIVITTHSTSMFVFLNVQRTSQVGSVAR